MKRSEFQRQVAFATYRMPPDMAEVAADDERVAEVLRSRGIPVTSVLWDDPEVDWAGFGCVVIRSTWDYHHKPDQYAAWLRRCASEGVRLWNPPEVVLANLNKRYLSDLADRGVEVVPTRYFAAGQGVSLREALESGPWEEAVIKPAVSASAQGTWRTSAATADVDQDRFEAQLRDQDLLVQPYLKEIATQGEWSLVFFAGEYSHAALKRPAPGDFRVQEHHGGNAVPANPPPHLIAQAREALSKVSAPLLYARVDGIERAGRFVLMELEINEPTLYLGFSNEAAYRFAEAITATMPAL